MKGRNIFKLLKIWLLPVVLLLLAIVASIIYTFRLFNNPIWFIIFVIIGAIAIVIDKIIKRKNDDIS